MTPRVLVNGQARDQVSVFDRGLGYGDGLFETIRFAGGTAPLWPRHMQRLAHGCSRLGLLTPDSAVFLHEAREASHELTDAVVRITLTRGIGERGYRPPAKPEATRIVAAFAPPPIDEAVRAEGLSARVCATRLAAQPLLAGLKHLNRLEQVLARAEWDDPAIAEGLMCDFDGMVICATAANLFMVAGGVIATPTLDRCGVAGVARAEILAIRPHVELRSIRLAELRDADELFLSSSVRGILPVRELDGHVYAVGPVTRALQAHWRALGF